MHPLLGQLSKALYWRRAAAVFAQRSRSKKRCCNDQPRMLLLSFILTLLDSDHASIQQLSVILWLIVFDRATKNNLHPKIVFSHISHNIQHWNTRILKLPSKSTASCLYFVNLNQVFLGICVPNIQRYLCISCLDIFIWWVEQPAHPEPTWDRSASCAGLSFVLISSRSLLKTGTPVRILGMDHIWAFVSPVASQAATPSL